ncbi:NadR type nicotinamide-nucleotide adenylyltransferase [Plasticicumulans lactativorans]|uniref:NadR type nicotinamide-nucleotide adenylyltransferase n=1 Tax=Plasticicumulans lactativorans TaxID=1133106 RepID=A0A4R2KNP4_9GAMM|nr:NadR type nicotinamide-nucleotide adenylyltransferase [Plasticicumulans lactativorans]
MNPPLRVLLIGPESTGKTTLARTLAARYGEPWVAEFVREHLAAAGRHEVRFDDLAAIVAGQLDAAARAARRARRLLICDTAPLATAIYARHYFGRCPPRLLARARADAHRYAVVLLADTDLPFAADPLRDPAQDRTALRTAFRRTLQRLGIAHRWLRGRDTTRLAAARAAVEAALRRRRNDAGRLQNSTSCSPCPRPAVSNPDTVTPSRRTRRGPASVRASSTARRGSRSA